MDRFFSTTLRALLLCLAVQLTGGCKESDKRDMSAPGPVSDVTAVGGFGRVTLRWKIPDDNLYYYTKIEYTDPATGKTVWAYADKYAADAQGYSQAIIGGYMDQQEYQYSLTAHGFGYGISEAVTVSCRPLEAAFNQVAATVELEPDMMGGVLSWVNDSGVPVIIRAVYTDPYGNEAVSEYLAESSGKMRVGSIGTGEQNIRVFVLDETGTNSSAVIAFSAFAPDVTQTPVFLDRSGWVYTEVSSVWEGDGTNWEPHNLLDDDFNSCWHTSPFWGDYPFWTVFDMGAETLVTSVSLFTRNWPGQEDGPDVIGFELSEDGETWYEAGTFDFNRVIWEEQNFQVRQVVYGARYLKLKLLSGPANYSYVSELYAYGKLR